MNRFKNFLRNRSAKRLQRMEANPYPPTLKGDPRLLDPNDIRDWMSAAELREFRVWLEIDYVLQQLRPLWPRRTKYLHKELMWLREQAGRYSMDWAIKHG